MKIVNAQLTLTLAAILLAACNEAPPASAQTGSPAPPSTQTVASAPVDDSLNRGLLKASEYPCDPGAVDFFLDKGADPNAQIPYSEEPLQAAINAIATFYKFTEGQSRQSQRLQGQLDDAARCEHVVATLVERGADPDRWFVAAVSALSPRSVQIILDKGAHPNQPRMDMNMSIGLPIELLLGAFPVDMTTVSQYDEARAERGNTVFKMLYDRLDLDTFNQSRHDLMFDRGRPALARLVPHIGKPDLRLIEFWLEAGADPCQKTAAGKTPADLALEYNLLDAYRLLDRCQ